MIFLKKPAHELTIALALLISMVMGLPQGLDLELCFGIDGHIDFALNSCLEDSSDSLQERSVDYNTGHHVDCFDVVVCSITHELIDRDKTATKHVNTYSGKNKYLPQFSPGFSRPLEVCKREPFSNWRFRSHHIGALRSVVLLI